MNDGFRPEPPSGYTKSGRSKRDKVVQTGY